MYHLYKILFDGEKFGASARDLVHTLVNEEGIQASTGLNMPNYLHKLYRDRGYERGLCPVAERVHVQSVGLPIYPLLELGHMDIVIEAVKSAVYRLKHQ